MNKRTVNIRLLLLPAIIFIFALMNASLGAFAAVSSLTLHRVGFDEMPSGTINFDFTPDLRNAEIKLTGSFQIHETDAFYQIITKNGNTNGKTITENGSATIKWSNAGTDADGDSVDVVLNVTNYTHSGNSEKACIIKYDKALKSLWNGANVPEDAGPLHTSSVDIAMKILKHGTEKTASGTYLLAFVDIDQAGVGERVKILDGANDVYVQPDCTCSITENNTLFSATQNDNNNSLLSGFITITNSSPSWRMMVGKLAGTMIFKHFDQYDFVATTTDGGTITNVGTKKVNWHTGITYKMTPKAGYHMKKLTVDGKVVPNASTYSFTMATAGHTIDVEWEANSYNIAYDKNGGTGSMPNQTMQYDIQAKLTKNAFTREGYSFTGWRMGNSLSGTEYQDEASVTNLTSDGNGSVTMYAQWSPISYTIAFDKNRTDAIGTTSSMSMKFDVAKNLTANGFTSASSKFAGWNSNADGTGSAYKDGQNVKNLASTDGATVTLYAVWSTNTYTVSFVDGHDGTTITTARIPYGGNATPPTKPHHDGYTPTSWDGDYTDVTSDRTITLGYRPNAYRIAFKSNGGTGSMPNQDMEYGKESALSSNLFTKTGYTFSGWRLGNSNTGTKYSDRQKVVNLTVIDGDVVTMYAQWVPNGYTIKYNSNGGTGTMTDQAMTYDVSAKLDANRFTRSGYTWIGWKRDNATSGTTYRNRQEVVNLLSASGGTTTMYAQWSPNSYTVTFIDGFSKKTIETQGVNYGQPAKEPARPSHTGYTATGWDSDFSNVTGDMTVTLNYRPNRYTIRFNGNATGVNGSTADVNATYGTAVNLTKNGYSLDGHTWMMWTDDSAGNGTQYGDRQSVTNLTFDDGGTVTLYAKWKTNRYTVSFVDGKTGDTIGRQEVEYGKPATAPDKPSHIGYKAGAWDRDFSSVKGNMTVTVPYSPIGYRIQFDANCDSFTGSTKSMSMTYGQPANLTANGYKRDGYRFIGWATSGNGDIAYRDRATVSNLSDTDGDTVTLYAVWGELDHATISYIVEPAGSGSVTRTSESLNPETGTSEGSKAVPSEGYEFIGWHIGDTLVTKNDELIPQKPQDGWKTTTYTAIFKKKTFTVTFMSKSNDILKEETVEYGDGATAPDAPHVDGYEFIGWDKTFDNVTEDITVTALYRELPIAPAPAQPTTPEPTPEPAAEPQVTDGQANDLIQTGISVAPIAMAGSFAGIAAIAARRRKSAKR